MGLLKIVILLIASVNLLFTLLIYFRLRQPTSVPLWAMKVFIASISPLLFATGLFSGLLGWVLHSEFIVILGAGSALLYLVHLIKTTRPPHPANGFERAFEKQLESNILKEKKAFYLTRRYVLHIPKSPDPVFEADVPFYTIPDSNRRLLCDIWQPPEHIPRSGLAFIYLHGSAWTVLDKDFGTRTFFRRMASQGHVIMDVAYRLFPETGFLGMIQDAQRAIVWMKTHSTDYQVNPDHIVIGGGSAGGHLALLAAYTANKQSFLSEGLIPADVNVDGVIALYGPTDLAATYYHARQDIADAAAKNKKEVPAMPAWVQKRMGEKYHKLGFDKDVEPGMLTPMLGGNPRDIPEVYAQFSPITHVHSACPPTLLIQGAHDILVPVEGTRALYERLTAAKVPAILHLIPQTDHAFDLIMPKLSPSAHNAIFDIERFLAILATP